MVRARAKKKESRRAGSAHSLQQVADYWDRVGHPRIVAMEDVCWCCGRITMWLERAHIEPICEGGVDEPSNIHLLCRSCHTDTEFMRGKLYWQYLESMVWRPDFEEYLRRARAVVRSRDLKPADLQHNTEHTPRPPSSVSQKRGFSK